MKTRIATRALGFGALVGLVIYGLGCELSLDFDRSLIDGGVIGPSDATFFDSPILQDRFVPSPDAEVTPDGAADAPETRPDTGSDAPVDTGSDAGDASDAGAADASDSSDADDGSDAADD